MVGAQTAIESSHRKRRRGGRTHPANVGRSALVEDKHAVVRYPITRLEVAMRVVERLHLHDILLPNLVQEVGHHFVEMILAHFHAIVVTDAFGAKLDSLVSRSF